MSTRDRHEPTAHDHVGGNESTTHGHGDHTGAGSDFDARAATWDDAAKVARARRVADAIVEAAAPGESARLFEYGAGTGLVTEALGDRVGSALLADSSAGMRDVMAAKVADGRLANATITDLNLADPRAQLPAERFDLIVTVLTLHHVEDLDLVLGRFADMLDFNGQLCIVDLDAEDGSFHGEGFSGHHGFDRDGLADRLRAAGFDDARVTDCGELERDEGSYSMFLAVARSTSLSTNGT